MVSIDTMGGSTLNRESKRIESESDVQSYLSKLKYALDNKASINFQEMRVVDLEKDLKHTNKYTIGELFPDENPVDALRRELKTLTVQEYLETVKDIKFPKKQEMRVFGRKYPGFEEVYIKIRVELVNPTNFGGHTTFVMSFHFAEHQFKKEDFPYRK